MDDDTTPDGPGMLGAVCTRDSPAAVQALYRDWAKSYEADMRANRYAAPARIAAALAKHVPGDARAGPVLDIGCGTGLSGEALAAKGFSTIDGTDTSPEMLEIAARKRIYRALLRAPPDRPLPVAPESYANAVAVGVISPRHAPPEMLDAALGALRPGGCLAFSLNDEAMKVPAYQGRLCEALDSGSATLLFKEHGPHLPGIGLDATVFVLRKT